MSCGTQLDKVSFCLVLDHSDNFRYFLLFFKEICYLSVFFEIAILNFRYRSPHAFHNLHFPLIHGPNFERLLDLSYALPGRLPFWCLSWDMRWYSPVYKLCRESRLV